MDTKVKSSYEDLIIPREKTNKRKQRSVLIEVNSRDRNVLSYPNPNQFRWRLQRPLKDILSIQIVGGSIPTRIFNINTGYNQFSFQEDGNTYVVSITPGIYDFNSLAVEIASEINNLPNIKCSYSCGFSPTTDQFTITQDHGPKTPFSLLFGTGDFVDLYQNNVLLMINSPTKLLGFQSQNYSDNGTRRITGPFGADLDFLNNRIYLYINVENSQDLTTIERSAGKRDPYSIIYLNHTDTSTYRFFDKDTFEPCYLSSPAPVARISTLDLEMRDEFYRLINMNGHDFTLLLEFVTLE